ncbi:MAG: n-acetylglutamate synthase [Bacteroidota bacterium]
MTFDLNHRKFKSLHNSDNGEVGDDTVFHYRQAGKLIWGEYGGGQIQKGFLVGQIEGDELSFTYQHINADFEAMTGKCQSKISLTAEGRYQLNERWQWTSGDLSEGESVLVEL